MQGPMVGPSSEAWLEGQSRALTGQRHPALVKPLAVLAFPPGQSQVT